MPETQNIRNDNAHEQGIRFLSLLNLMTLLSTLRKKPGALRNSAALKAEPELKSIYDNYFSEKPREFIEILTRHKDLSFDELKDLLRMEACLALDNHPVYEPLCEQLQGYQALFA